MKKCKKKNNKDINPLASARSAGSKDVFATSNIKNKNVDRTTTIDGGGGGGGGGGSVFPVDNDDHDGASLTTRSNSHQMKTGNNNKTSSNNNNNKSILKAQQLWHKRSGGGLHLFVEYYCGQPDGVVIAVIDQHDDDDDEKCTDDDDTTAIINDNSVHNNNNNNVVVVGMGVSSYSINECNGRGGANHVPTTTTNGGMRTKGSSRASQRRNKKRKRNQQQQQQQEQQKSQQQPEHQSIEHPSSKKFIKTDDDAKDGRYAQPSVIPTLTSLSAGHGNDIQLLYDGQLLRIFESSTKNINIQRRRRQRCLANFFITISRPLPITFRFRITNIPHLVRQQQKLQKELSDPTLVYRDHVRVLDEQQHQQEERNQPSTSYSDDNKGDAHYSLIPARTRTTMIYQAHNGLDKKSLKRTCPELKDFLNVHSQDGTIARQELGSMLPVILLHAIGSFVPDEERTASSSSSSLSCRRRVLDLCASPGSKTLQAAELVVLAGGGGGGRVRANDINESRLRALRDAVDRSGISHTMGLKDHTSVIKYSNIDASMYPIPKTEAKKYPIILCDVPCSGDGTCRKDLHILPTWYPRIGNLLHKTQVRILIRALQCVQVGGTVAYSTCSLNPIEDEAVVLAALDYVEKSSRGGDDGGHNNRRIREPQQTSATKRGSASNHQKEHRIAAATAVTSSSTGSSMAFELVQIPRGVLSGPDLRPGVNHWRVADYDEELDSSNNNEPDHHHVDNEDDEAILDEERPPRLQWYDTYQDALGKGMVGAFPSMWPPSSSPQTTQTTTIIQHDLSRCGRLWPQDRDCGGFFVALIRRTR